MNLMVNARQAFDACQRAEKLIRVGTGMKNNKVCIEVADNASGIQEDIIGKIFDPFFTTKEVGQGTGLGLTISRSIVKEFNGEITVFNNEQGGVTFQVALPPQGGSR
jgi:C4-dicarboxylate-specific signal transduction histidine kinase